MRETKRVDQIIQGIESLVARWKETKPRPKELTQSLEAVSALATKLDDQPQSSWQQSFCKEYFSFALRTRSKARTCQKAKAKGKRDPTRGVILMFQSLTCRRFFPAGQIISCANAQSMLELGREPQAAVTVCISITQISQMQTLAQVHGIDSKLVLIA